MKVENNTVSEGSCSPADRSKKWFSRRWWLTGCAVLLLIIFHASVLPWVVRPLTVDDKIVPTKYLLFMSDARLSQPAFQYSAAFLAEEQDRRVLLYSGYIRRAEAIGAEPAYVEFVMREMEENGIDRNRIDVIRRPKSMNYTHMFRELGNWLSERPGDEILLMTHSFRPGYTRKVASKVLSADLRQRIHVLGLASKGIDEHSWWKSSTGVKWIMTSYLSVFHLTCFGEFEPRYSWDPDEYERSLGREAEHAVAF